MRYLISFDVVDEKYRKHYNDIYGILENDLKAKRPTVKLDGKTKRVVESVWILETKRLSAESVISDIGFALKIARLPPDLVSGGGIRFLVAPVTGKIGVHVDGKNLEVGTVEKRSKTV